MNSRERVRKAINHETPDRVPFDLGGSQVTGIHVDEYCELAKYYGLDVLPPKVYDPWQMLAIPAPEMLRALKSDIIVVENQSAVLWAPGRAVEKVDDLCRKRSADVRGLQSSD